MPSDNLYLYRILNLSVVEVSGFPITQYHIENGILLTEAQAALYVSNGILAPFDGSEDQQPVIVNETFRGTDVVRVRRAPNGRNLDVQGDDIERFIARRGGLVDKAIQQGGGGGGGGPSTGVSRGEAIALSLIFG